MLWQPDPLQSLPLVDGWPFGFLVMNEYCPPWQPSHLRAVTTVWFIVGFVNVPATLWHDEHAAPLVGMCPAGRAPPVAPANVVVDLWQVSHGEAVATWFADLPLAPAAVNEPV